MNQKSSNEEDKIDMKLVLSITIFICIGVILSFTYVIYDEIHSAKEGCKNINGTYKLNVLIHLCNDEVFYKYTNGEWGFEKVTDWSEMNFTLP